MRAGDCVLVEKIGQGGMGAVYRGRHLALDIDVAVKVLPFHAAADAKAVERFRREAQAAARIDHPNIVRVFDVKEERGVHYLVMEFVDGESADAWRKRKGPLPERDALEIAIAAGEALAAAHAKGILHRDVKPANIMIRFEDRRVKLADLGLAKALGREGGETTGLTATGHILGTPEYMSPEQAKGASRLDERTDIYSLGATLYALLSGRPPFEASQLLKLLLKVTREEPEDLRSLRHDVTEEAAVAVKKHMAKDAAQRPQTMREAVDLLRRCLESVPATLEDVTPEGLERDREMPPPIEAPARPARRWKRAAKRRRTVVGRPSVCRGCGAELRKGDTICSECGVKVGGPSAAIYVLVMVIRVILVAITVVATATMSPHAGLVLGVYLASYMFLSCIVGPRTTTRLHDGQDVRVFRFLPFVEGHEPGRMKALLEKVCFRVFYPLAWVEMKLHLRVHDFLIMEDMNGAQHVWD